MEDMVYLSISEHGRFRFTCLVGHTLHLYHYLSPSSCFCVISFIFLFALVIFTVVGTFITDWVDAYDGHHPLYDIGSGFGV